MKILKKKMLNEKTNIAVSFLSKGKICIVWVHYNCLYQSAIYSKGQVSEETQEFISPLYTTLDEALRVLFLETLPLTRVT